MITAAVDGSSLSNPGPAGWAWYIDDDHWAAGGWKLGTNNMGELMAVLDLLRATAESGQPLRVLCDSQYVINSVTKWMPGWKRRGWRKADGKPVLNLDLLKALDEALVDRDVTFEWVKGHAGHEMNEAADDRARAAATAYQTGAKVDAGPGFSGTGSTGESLDVAPTKPEPEPDLFSVTPDEPPARPAPILMERADDRDAINEIIALEKSLLTDDVRSNQIKVRQLMHPDFVEFGASGNIFTRGRMLSIIGPLENRTTFELLGADQLGPDLIILRWRSKNALGQALRSSLWQRHEGAWKLRFHQGTPTTS